MKTDLKHRIIYISAIMACSLTSASLLPSFQVILPVSLLIALLCVNIIPFRLLRSKGIQTNFGSNFRILVLLNSAVFLPITIYNLFPFSLELDSILGILVVAAVVFLIALTGSLVFRPMPASEPLEENMGTAMYDTKDVVLQPKPYAANESGSREYIPSGTLFGKTLGFKIAIWAMIGVMFLIPLYATIENGFHMFWFY